MVEHLQTSNSPLHFVCDSTKPEITQVLLSVVIFDLSHCCNTNQTDNFLLYIVSHFDIYNVNAIYKLLYGMRFYHGWRPYTVTCKLVPIFILWSVLIVSHFGNHTTSRYTYLKYINVSCDFSRDLVYVTSWIRKCGITTHLIGRISLKSFIKL